MRLSTKLLGLLLLVLGLIFIAQGFGALSNLSISPGTTVYFQCTFSKVAIWPEGTYWDPREPCPYPCEVGMWHWVNCRDLQGEARSDSNADFLSLVRDPTDTTRECLCLTLAGGASGDQHCKLYNAGLDPGAGATFEGYYYFPSGFNVVNWRLIMQWGDAESGLGYPSMEISFINWGWGQGKLFFISNPVCDPNREQRNFPLGYTFSSIPKNRWIKLTVFIKPSTTNTRDGTVQVWIDDNPVLDRNDICTHVVSKQAFDWGIGNYGGPSEQGSILIKDVAVYSGTSTPTLPPRLRAGTYGCRARIFPIRYEGPRNRFLT